MSLILLIVSAIIAKDGVIVVVLDMYKLEECVNHLLLIVKPLVSTNLSVPSVIKATTSGTTFAIQMLKDAQHIFNKVTALSAIQDTNSSTTDASSKIPTA